LDAAKASKRLFGLIFECGTSYWECYVMESANPANVTNFRYFDGCRKRIILFPANPHKRPGMKMVFDCARFAGRQPVGGGACLALAFALAVTAGCGKSNPPAESAAPPVSSDSASAPQTPSPVPIPVQSPQPTATTNASSLTSLQWLNRAMVGWMRENHRHPRDFEEFASTSNIQIPNPPPGKKYAFNNRGFIVLVDNSTQ
jgi:hypothetical protein